VGEGKRINGEEESPQPVPTGSGLDPLRAGHPCKYADRVTTDRELP